MKKWVKKGLPILFVLVLLAGVLSTGIIFPNAAQDGALTSTAPVYSGSKTAEWVAKDTLEIKITSVFDGVKDINKGKVLFLGTRCSAHSMDAKTIPNSVNVIARYADVRVHTYGPKGDKYRLDFDLPRGSTFPAEYLDSKGRVSMEYDNHKAASDFATYLYNQLKVSEKTTDALRKELEYDLIILEFDGNKIYDGDSGKIAGDDGDLTKMKALKAVLDNYYGQGRVVWVVPPASEDDCGGYPYKTNKNNNFVNYVLNGNGYQCPNQKNYDKVDELTDFLNTYVANYYGETIFTDTLANGLTVSKVIPEYKTNAGEWVEVTEAGIIEESYGKLISAKAVITGTANKGQKIVTTFDTVEAEKAAAAETKKYWGHDLRVRIVCEASVFNENIRSGRTAKTNNGDATIQFKDPQGEYEDITLELKQPSPEVGKAPHYHGGWVYSVGSTDATKNQMTATCGESGCSRPAYSPGTIKITAQGGTYDGVTSFPAVLSGATEQWTTDGLTIPTINYQSVSASGSLSEKTTTPPINAGKYRASITADKVTAYVDYVIDPKDVTEDQKLEAPTVKADKIADKAYTGKAITPYDEVVIKDTSLPEGKQLLKAGTDYTVEFKDNVNAGTATAVVSFKGNYTGTMEIPFTILPKDTLTAAANIKDIPDEMYTGMEITPEPVVVDTIDGKEVKLVKGTDYTIKEYKENIEAGENTASVVVELKGNYSGTLEKTFTILPKDVDEDQGKETPTVMADKISPKIYNGQEHCPVDEVIIKDITLPDGEQTLVKDKDYTVEFANNINVTTDDSKALAKVTFKGNYIGTMDIPFDIMPKDVTEDQQKESPTLVAERIADKTYTGKPITPDDEVIIKDTAAPDGKQVLKKGTDYTIDYRNNVNAGTATAVVTFKGNYTGTMEIPFAILPKDAEKDQEKDNPDITVENIPDQRYTGEAIEPPVVVKDGDTVLEKGKDYDVTYENNIDAGKATAVIVMKGNYVGTLRKDFNILPKNDLTAKNDMDDIPEQRCYKPEPKVTVRHGDKVLEEGKDYTVIYKNNETAGIATAVVTLMGNYEGTLEKDFVIKHQFVPRDGKKPDINIPGFKPYYECECGEFYEDPEGKIKIGNADDLAKWKAKGGRGYLEPLPTGDDTDMTMLIVMMGLSLAGMIVCSVAGKKKEKNCAC